MVSNSGKSSKKAIIVNAHFSNRGDEAALRAILDEMLSKSPGWETEIMFKDKDEVSGFMYPDVSHFSCAFLPKNVISLFVSVLSKGKICKNDNLRKGIEHILESDLIVYSPGGGVLSDKFWWVKQLEYFMPFICSKLYRIPIVVAAPSMGPFNVEKNIFRNSLKKCFLNSADKLIVREAISESYVKKLGVKNVVVTIDSAFYDDYYTHKESIVNINNDEKLNVFLGKYKKVVGLTAISYLWHIEDFKDETLPKRIEQSLKAFIERLKERNVGVLLIPQLFGNQDDTKLLEKYTNDNTFVLSNEYDTYAQQYVISKLYALVGMRYHSNIFAAKTGVPFVAVSYEEKMTGFMMDHNLTELMIPVKDISEKLLLSKYEMIDENHTKFEKRLKDKREEFRRLAKITVDSVISFMK